MTDGFIVFPFFVCFKGFISRSCHANVLLSASSLKLDLMKKNTLLLSKP